MTSAMASASSSASFVRSDHPTGSGDAAEPARCGPSAAVPSLEGVIRSSGTPPCAPL